MVRRGHDAKAGSMKLTTRYRLPAIYPFRFFAELGGLMSYGVDRTDNFRRAAAYVDRILNGEKPSELPVTWGCLPSV
jgi:putative tryptophan/tyrosine transport system substrate-binding protein